MIKRSLLLIVTALLFNHSCFAEEYARSLELAKLRISEIESNPEYLKHIEDVQSPYFQKAVLKAQEKCLMAFLEGGFELVIAISETGIIEKIYSNVETDSVSCVRSVFLKKAFPKPIVSPLYFSLKLF